jgi:hypothetical protein
MPLPNRICNREKAASCTILLLVCLCGGCASTRGPEFLTLPADSYQAAFSAAVEAARKEGMPATFRDLRSGVIETDPNMTASVLEAWRSSNSISQSFENTMHFQQRRARFEFSPAAFQPSEPSDELSGPDLLHQQTPQVDLTEYDGPIELRVWVYVERGYSPGIRRDTWTRTATTRTELVPNDLSTEPLPRQFWVPQTRDEGSERRLLARIEKTLPPPAAEP